MELCVWDWHYTRNLFLFYGCKLVQRNSEELHCKPRMRSRAHYASSAGARGGLPRMWSAGFSAIISTQALMWAETRSGIAEASTTRRFSMPRTRICGSSTLSGVVPIGHVPHG